MTQPDWSVLELDGLKDQVNAAATSVAAMYPTYFTAEDLAQEGLIWCAMNPARVREMHGEKLLAIRIWSRLQHKVQTEAAKQGNTIGLHRLYENGE